MSKILYKPFGIIFGLIAGFVSAKLFEVVWAKIDDEPPPNATTRDSPLPKVIGGAMVQAAVFAGTRAAVDRSGAKTFEYLTGIWPGDKVPEK